MYLFLSKILLSSSGFKFSIFYYFPFSIILSSYFLILQCLIILFFYIWGDHFSKTRYLKKQYAALM